MSLTDFVHKLKHNDVRAEYKKNLEKVTNALDAGNINSVELLSALPSLLAVVFQQSPDEDIKKAMQSVAELTIKIIRKIPESKKHEPELPKGDMTYA